MVTLLLIVDCASFFLGYSFLSNLVWCTDLMWLCGYVACVLGGFIAVFIREAILRVLFVLCILVDYIGSSLVSDCFVA